MKIAVINLADSSCSYVYDDSAPSPQKFGGPWSWADVSVHVQIPDDVVTAVQEVNGDVLCASVKGEQDGDIWSVVAA